MKSISKALAILFLLTMIFSCMPEDNIVQFDLNGTTIVLDLGFAATEGLPMAQIDTGHNEINVFGANEITPFTQPDTYGIIAWPIGSNGTFTAVLQFIDNTNVISVDGNVTVVLDKWGNVGEYCSGLFSGTIGSDVITDGIFNVKRAPDDTFAP